MDKKSFLSQYSEEKQFTVAKIWDNILLCQEIEYPIYLDEFYSENILIILEKYVTRLRVSIHKKGLNENCEKKIVCIAPNSFELLETKFPVKYFEINGKNKFKKLEHKDFLGTIMSLGIKRELMGDLIVKDSICYGIIKEELLELLKEKIELVGKIPVKIQEIGELKIPDNEFKERVEILASLRLDVLVSEIIQKSRTEAIKYLEAGEVFLNYEVEKKNSKLISEGDTLTIRKKGKFIIEKILEETKKGKIKVSIKQYI
jgi:RNA-binding protein YlmH